jgi:uncharacterized protein YceH (UPF0502 family)
VDIILNSIELRVLGALVEKEITTPEYYPLSLNALVNACNQKNNRDPVMELSEGTVRQALDSLSEKALAGVSRRTDSRVVKFEHHLQEVFNFNRRETAVLCVLMLRGPQTPGELRGRTERMHRFDDLGEVQTTLQWLMKREPPLVKILPRQSGTKEARYAHLLAGDIEGWEAAPEPETTPDYSTAERIARLEDQVSLLQKQVDDLKETLAEIRKQSE